MHPDATVEVVELLVLVDVVLLVLLLVDDDEVLEVVGPEQPHMPFPIGPQSSAGRGQSRLGSGQLGGESCEQSASAETQAHVPFMRSHRHARPALHAPPHVPPSPSGWSEHGPEITVVLVVLLVLVVLVDVVLLVLVDVVDVLVEVGPKHPHEPPPTGPQSSTGRGQSRLGSGQLGGESCEQSASAETHAQVPFMRSHRQKSPGAHVPPQVPPKPSGWSEHAPDGMEVVVVLLVVVEVELLVLVVDDDVLLEVGPKQPHMPPPIGPQLSTGRRQRRLGSGQLGGESCEQSAVGAVHAQTPFM